MERLSGLDASFLYLETPSLHMHVALTLVFDPSTVPGGYSFERMKRSIDARLPSAPVFRRRLVEVPFRLGHPVWVDDPTSTSTTTSDGPPCRSRVDSAELADLAGDIAGRQLDRARAAVGDVDRGGPGRGPDRLHRQDAPLDRRRGLRRGCSRRALRPRTRTRPRRLRPRTAGGPEGALGSGAHEPRRWWPGPSVPST